MRQVRLGQTDLRVSAIAFGTWAFGGDWGAPTPRRASTPSTTLLGGGDPSFDQLKNAPVELDSATSVVEDTNVTYTRYRVRYR